VSMEHKAFVFDYDRFTTELGPALWHALEKGKTGKLVRFTVQNRHRLSDPYEGGPLPDGWVAPDDVHEIGDVALTAFYDPAADVGLADGWERAHDRAMRLMPGQEDAVVLGYPFGPDDAAFDPGRMGSYFRSADMVQQHLGALVTAGPPKRLVPVAAMLRHAATAGQGLYVTF
jgi:hypothetical protein